MVVFGGLRWVSVDSGQFRRDHRGRVLGFLEIDFFFDLGKKLSIWYVWEGFDLFGRETLGEREGLGERHAGHAHGSGSYESGQIERGWIL